MLLQLAFPEKEKKRMRLLSAKAQSGTLTSEEEKEMEGHERAGALLSTLKSKARQIRKNTTI